MQNVFIYLLTSLTPIRHLIGANFIFKINHTCLFFQDPDIIDTKGDHSKHLPGDKLLRKQSQNRRQELAQTSRLPTRSVLTEIAAGRNEEELAVLPKQDSMKRQVQRERQKMEQDPKDPDERTGFDIDEKYIKYFGEHFLRVDTGPDDPKRILIFVTDEGIKDMQIYEHWSTDGTFKSRPKKIFKQVITFHIHINETQTVAR